MGDCGCTANLVNSNATRSVRFGGNWNNGGNDGFNFNGNNAPSNANANYGGDLYLSRTQKEMSPVYRDISFLQSLLPSYDGHPLFPGSSELK